MIQQVVSDARCAIRRGMLTCTLRLRPTPASRTYTVRLEYRPPQHPRVTVIDPVLRLPRGVRHLPHTYAGDVLCLYTAEDWRHDMALAETIVPWISEWLMFYEGWLATGAWDGGGDDHYIARARPTPLAPSDCVS